MRFSILHTLVAASCTLLAACSGSVSQSGQNRSVDDFQQLRASGSIDVYLRQGSHTSVKVEADSDILDQIKTEVEDDRLVIYRDNSALSFSSRLQDSGDIKVYVTCPRLTSVEVSGASEIKSETPFRADDFRIKASGASDVTLHLEVENLTASASGASELRLSGRARHQEVSISGSSEYSAADLQSKEAEVHASGASDAYVSVTDELSSHSSGASDIRFKGNPRVRK